MWQFRDQTNFTLVTLCMFKFSHCSNYRKWYSMSYIFSKLSLATGNRPITWLHLVEPPMQLGHYPCCVYTHILGCISPGSARASSIGIVLENTWNRGVCGFVNDRYKTKQLFIWCWPGASLVGPTLSNVGPPRPTQGQHQTNKFSPPRSVVHKPSNYLTTSIFFYKEITGKITRPLCT